MDMRDKASHPVKFGHILAFFCLLAGLIPSIGLAAQSKLTLEDDWVIEPFHLNHGIRRTADTLYLPLSPSTQFRYLLVENPHINHIGLDRLREGSRFKSGDSLAFSMRPFPFRMFAFPIREYAGRDTIRLILEKKGENLSYTIRMLDQWGWERYVRTDDRLTGFITGCYLLVGMIGLVLLYFNRQFKFLFFNAYVITSLGWFLNDTGLLFQFLWPDHPSWHNSSRGFFSSITMAFFGSYLYQNPGSRILLGVRKAMYVLAGIIVIKISTSAMAATGFFPPSLKPLSMYVNAVALSGLFGYVAFSLLLKLRQFNAERFEILAIVTYSLFIFQLGLYELGLRPFEFSAFHHMELIVFFFVQITCMALHLFTMDKKRKEAEAEHILQITREQDRILSERLIEMEEQEKRRIARNIHDEIGSLFAAMKYRILALGSGQSSSREDLDQLMHICNEGIEKQYSVVDEMVLHRATGKDFEQSIRDKFYQLFGHRSVALEFKYELPEDIPDEFQRIQLFRIITELMTNTLKHANASHVWLNMEVNEKLIITYMDDGPGFDLTLEREGRGLSNIGNRVAYLQGRSMIDRYEDGNCSFSILIPIRHE
jgi:signal transduction histidine kinase